MLEPIIIDFETYYDKEYSLDRMTTESYVRDPRFDPLCAGFVSPSERGVIPQERLHSALSSFRLNERVVIMHHAHFDGLILTHHFGIQPAFYIDTLSMARMVLGPSRSHSLASLCAFYGLSEKTVPYGKFIGHRWADMDPALRDELMQGALDDCLLTGQLLEKLRGDFPDSELFNVDMTVKMFTEPRLIGDQRELHMAWQKELVRKDQVLQSIGYDRTMLSSNESFKHLLEGQGVQVEYKKGKNGPIPAFAKTDQFMQDLCEHENERVAMLATARLEIKSTLNETRASKLLAHAERGPLCIYLKAYGANNTLRWSGADGTNFQNLPKKKDLTLRHAIQAPPGHKLIVADKSQIECRVLNTIAGQWDIIKLFEEKRDVYCEGPMAEPLYHRVITKANYEERQFLKKTELGCGYGMGDEKFFAQCIAEGLRVETDLCQNGVCVYRITHPQVVALWYEGDRVLSQLAHKTKGHWLNGLVEIRDGKLILPNGSYIHYDVRWNHEEATWERAVRHGWTSIWGGGLVENVTQALSRIDLAETCERIYRASDGYLRPVLLVHDEGVWAVANERTGWASEIITTEFKRTASWLPDCPMDGELSILERYAKQ